MFYFRSRYLEPLQLDKSLPPVRITLPNGTVVDSNQADINTILSEELGRSVRLESKVPQTPNLEEYWPNVPELDNRDVVTV